MIQSAFRLRHFNDQDDSSDERFWTLRQAFEAKTLPILQRRERSSGSIAKWKKAIWYWEQVTSNPPICHIKDEDLTDLPDKILSPEARLAITTNTSANQQLMYCRGILRNCEKILGSVPKGLPLPLQAPTRHRRLIKPDALDAIYRACKFARYDHRRCQNFCTAIPAPLIMRAALVLFTNIGCRRSEGFLMERAAYHRQSEFPDLPEIEVDAESPFGWLVFHTPKTRARKNGLPLVVPVSETLAKHLDALDQLAPRRQRLLPFGDHPSCWRNHLNRIQAKAGIDQPYTWQDLRKTANRSFRKAAGREVAKFMLGHQPRGVNATWYDELTEDAVEAVQKLQQPNAFLEIG